MNNGILDAETIVSYHISRLSKAYHGHFLSDLGGFENVDLDDEKDIDAESVVNGIHENDAEDDDVVIIGDNNSEQPKFSASNELASTENRVNKSTETKSNPTLRISDVKLVTSNQEYNENGDADEIICLSSSDDEDLGQIKVTTVESIKGSTTHNGDGPKKEKVIRKVETDGFIIYISDEEEVGAQDTVVVKKPDGDVNVKTAPRVARKSTAKSKGPKSKKVEWESDSSSSSRAQSPTSSLSDSFEHDSNDEMIYLLHNHSSAGEDEDDGIELDEEKVGKLDDEDENMNEVDEKNASSHMKHSYNVRRTNRRRPTAKPTCPCCIGSGTTKKKEHVIVKDKLDIPENHVIKKRKLEPSVPVQKNHTKVDESSSTVKLVSEIAPKIDEKTNVKYYCCPLCSFKYEEKSELTGHWRAKHAVSVGCEKDIFNFLEPLRKNTKCTICIKMTDEYDNVKHHILWHNKSNKSVDDCVLCSMLFNKLKSHMLNHEPYRCRMCTKGFTNDIALNNHLITHLYEINEGQSSVKSCKLCKRTFNSIYDNILEHLISHHADFNIITTDDLVKHKVKLSVRDVNAYKANKMKTHNGDVKLDPTCVCLHCTLTFEHVHSFVRHLQMTHKSEHECKICNSQFETYRELQTHTKLQHHDANERFDCPACKKTFTDVMAFRNHFRVHSEHEMDNYSCPVCSNVLYNLYSLKRHLLIHTGEKPYPCDKCDLKFRDKSNLNAHVTAMHLVNQKMSCSICEIEFSSELNLNRHMKRNHCSIA